jgi:hypothetical protein
MICLTARAQRPHRMLAQLAPSLGLAEAVNNPTIAENR